MRPLLDTFSTNSGVRVLGMSGRVMLARGTPAARTEEHGWRRQAAGPDLTTIFESPYYYNI